MLPADFPHMKDQDWMGLIQVCQVRSCVLDLCAGLRRSLRRYRPREAGDRLRRIPLPEEFDVQVRHPMARPAHQGPLDPGHVAREVRQGRYVS